jgi:hypothetical protein
MTNQDELEFWMDDKPFTFIASSYSPMIDEIVVIEKKNYRVDSRNFAVDYNDDLQRRRMRLICNLEEV